MRRVLVVSYYFPPLGGMGSLRVAGFATHLPAHGWEPVVLAPRDGAYHRDPTLRFPEDKVVRTASFELSRTAKRALRTGGDDIAPAPITGARDHLRRAARTLVYHPDSQVGWYPPALRAGRRDIVRRPVDAVLSSSFPVTSHLIGRRIARAAGVPWIADWRDPWSEMLPDGVARRRAARMERRLARDASAIVMTSPSWADRHSKLWGTPVEVIPNGHDLDASEPRPPRELILSYMGSYYPATQDLSAVWPAIRTLDQAADARHVARIRFIGNLHPELRAALDAHDLASRTEVTGWVGHDQAIEELRRSSALLLAGPRAAGGILRGQVAGKIPEYLATGLPILYTGDTECDAADLVRAHAGCFVVATGDAVAMVAALRGCHDMRFERDVSSLSRHALAGRLAALLDGVAR